MSRQAKQQVKNEVRAILKRYLHESDLEEEEIAQEAMNAINDFLGDDLVEFTPEE